MDLDILQKLEKFASFNSLRPQEILKKVISWIDYQLKSAQQKYFTKVISWIDYQLKSAQQKYFTCTFVLNIN